MFFSLLRERKKNKGHTEKKNTHKKRHHISLTFTKGNIQYTVHSEIMQHPCKKKKYLEKKELPDKKKNARKRKLKLWSDYHYCVNFKTTTYPPK